MLGIIGDLCEIYGPRIKDTLNQQIIGYLIDKMKNSGISKYVKLGEWSTYVIFYLTYRNLDNKLCFDQLDYSLNLVK